MRLKEKVSVVTGAAKGIGREIALRFAQEGADVAAWDVETDEMESLKTEIEGKGRRFLGLQVDVSDFDTVKTAVENVLDGFSRIDILINNAGITRDNLIIRMSEVDWDSVIDVNLKGVFNCTKAISRVMLKQKSGRIINISSVIGIFGNAGQSNYAASKGGIISFTKSIAKELASRGITVNAIAPGFIDTGMTGLLGDEVREKYLQSVPLRRMGTGKDVAEAALFLASDQASYITGETIRVDGGLAM
ncbi:3-oxoacyl-[acyl-carrier-protein] reductase [candidate division TA06 bacterium]|uniref:3-oxoacyl-[acyl-carrier-protein] reductase n=1 Tax=candidate division TA06 bacterium TaxID=2250710 RepID=A0A523XSV2_UNCT6|nr:MAG: 3-oxoacyl-[acyl-carrier-protein] reductase [candidate division TA06 bacterium]